MGLLKTRIVLKKKRILQILPDFIIQMNQSSQVKRPEDILLTKKKKNVYKRISQIQ